MPKEPTLIQGSAGTAVAETAAESTFTMEPVQTSAPDVASLPATQWPADEYSGQPGTYVRDPVTGVRRPASEDI